MRANIKVTYPHENMPRYQTMGASGMDLRADHGGRIPPGKWQVIKTGIHLEIPYGYEAQVRPRSGLAAKYGVTVLNSPGTIDADFRGEIGVILINHGDDDFFYERGDRIAQLVFAPVSHAELYLVEELHDTPRGANGFGSTGVT